MADLTDDQKKELSRVTFLQVGGPIANSSASINIYADDLDPKAITGLVGCEPTDAVRKGEKNPKYPKRPPARIGRWSLEAPEELPLEQKIAFLLHSTSHRESVWEEIAETHRIVLSCVVYMSSWNEGCDIPSELIESVGKRKWTMGFSIYSADGDDIINSFLARGMKSGKLEKLSSHIARQIRQLYFGGNCVGDCLKQALNGVSWEQAVKKVSESNSIAELVHKINSCVDAVCKVFESESRDEDVRPSFERPALAKPSDWNTLCEKAYSYGERFAELAEALPDGALHQDFADGENGNCYRNIVGVIEHTQYCLGQIILLKKLV